jgi:adenylate cyclase
MTASKPGEPFNEEFWREFLIKGSPMERAGRRVFGRIPHGPRCRMCGAPFEGPGAPVMRLIGKRRSEQTPHWCTSCFTFMSRHHGGAEIVLTFLFADVRGSTPMAERLDSAEYRGLLSRFYETAADVVFQHDGAISQFVGDEVVSFFIPALAGDRHAARGVEAAQALLRATGHSEADGPWLPLGAGVHTGPAWIGTVGAGSRTEFTALGDTVNTTSRLASAAQAGEILVSADAAMAAGLDPALEHRLVELKGKEGTTEVVTLTVASER